MSGIDSVALPESDTENDPLIAPTFAALIGSSAGSSYPLNEGHEIVGVGSSGNGGGACPTEVASEGSSPEQSPEHANGQRTSSSHKNMAKHERITTPQRQGEKYVATTCVTGPASIVQIFLVVGATYNVRSPCVSPRQQTS
jgi:hypothetical protein